MLAVLYGCASADVDGSGQEDAKPETAPGQATETAPPTAEAALPAGEAAPAKPASGLGAAGFLGPVPDGKTPAADAAAVRGRIFNGAYAVELGSADRRRARKAVHAALEWLPVGQMKVWRNPDNGHWGTVMATRTYQDAKGLWCREYRQTVTLGGDENQETAAACRSPDGVWQPTG